MKSAEKVLADASLDLFSQDGQGLRGLMPSQSQQVRVHSQVMQRCKITLYTCKLKLCTYEYEVVLADGVGSEASAAQESVDEDATSKKSPDPAACLADGVGAVASAAVPDEQEASTQPQGKAKRHRISQKQAEANDDNAKDEGLDGAVAITPRAKKTKTESTSQKKTVAKTLRQNLKTQTALVKDKTAEIKKLKKKFDHWKTRHPTNILSVQCSEKAEAMTEEELKQVMAAWAAMTKDTGRLLQTLRA